MFMFQIRKLPYSVRLISTTKYVNVPLQKNRMSRADQEDIVRQTMERAKAMSAQMGHADFCLSAIDLSVPFSTAGG